MGRKSREHRERREAKSAGRQLDKAGGLEEELRRMADDDAMFWTSKNCPADLRESNLQDILAFESVGSGTSLFDGLEKNGLDLPRPETLDEEQSARKVAEVLQALQELQILLIGYEAMSARQFYRTLWKETLWEGCYVKKRNRGALTIIDVSRSIPRSEILAILERAAQTGSVQ